MASTNMRIFILVVNPFTYPKVCSQYHRTGNRSCLYLKHKQASEYLARALKQKAKEEEGRYGILAPRRETQHLSGPPTITQRVNASDVSP